MTDERNWKKLWAPATKGGYEYSIVAKNADSYLGVVRDRDRWVFAEWDLNGEHLGEGFSKLDLHFQGVVINGRMLPLPDGVGEHVVAMRFLTEEDATDWQEALRFV